MQWLLVGTRLRHERTALMQLSQRAKQLRNRTAHDAQHLCERLPNYRLRDVDLDVMTKSNGWSTIIMLSTTDRACRTYEDCRLMAR